MTRISLLMVVLGLMIAGAIWLQGQPAHAQPVDDLAALADRCRALTDGSFPINVLILVDASASLNSTDPDLRRISGVIRSADTLNALDERYGDEVDIQVAVDSYSLDYHYRMGWVSAETAVARLGEAPMQQQLSEAVGGTNYEAALVGAANRFREAPSSHCNLLIWFTDGEHDTEIPGELVAAEVEALRRLCNSNLSIERMVMTLSVTTLSVVLSHPDRPIDQTSLELLYDKLGGCRNPLVGGIQTYEEASTLGEELDEIIAEAISSNVCSNPLPGEVDDCGGTPAPEEHSPCETTTTQDCVYTFQLDDTHEAFRIYVDQTSLHRGITHPNDIYFVVKSPSGTESAIIRPADADETGWHYVAPHNYWAFRPYDSRWQVIGHRAAKPKGSEWTGEWSVIFGSDTFEGLRDAQRVAAAVRLIPASVPSVEDPRTDGNGHFKGYFSEGNEQRLGVQGVTYTVTKLYLAPTDATGALFYPTWTENTGYLTLTPLVLDDDNGLTVENIGKTLFDWDNKYDIAPSVGNDCEIKGGGKMLAAAWSENGLVLLQPILEREFLYGPEAATHTYTTRIQFPYDASEALQEAAGVDELEASKAACVEMQSAQQRQREERQRQQGERQRVIGWIDEDGSLLPTRIMLKPQHLDEGLDMLPRFPVSAPPDRGTVRRVGAQVIVSGSNVPWEAELLAIRFDPESPHRMSNAHNDTDEKAWRCTNYPSSQELSPFDGVASNPIVCGDWVTASVSESTNFSISVDVKVTSDLTAIHAYLESINWNEEAPQERREQLAAILDSAKIVALTASSEPFPIRFPRSPWPMFGSLAAALVALTVILRILRAAILRRWVPLKLPEYLVAPLEHQEASELNVCPDLVRRSADADLIHVKLRSGWLRPLFSMPRNIKAVAKDDCWTSTTTIPRSRSKKTTASYGSLLQEGWVAVRCVDGLTRLVIWDLPSEDDRTAGWEASLAGIRAEAAAKRDEIELARTLDALGKDEDVLASPGHADGTDPLTD